MSALSSKTTQDLSKDIDQEAYRKAAASTLASIHEVVSTAELTYFSNRSIAEVEALQEEVSAVIPAGNIVGLVLGGLVRLRDRTLPVDQAKTDVGALLRGVEMLPRHILPSTLYGTFFIGPAAVLAAYQKLLTLAGKDANSAFPQGLWQFYLEFALREDSARHTNETIGFQQTLSEYEIDLPASDQLAAWVCAASQIYFQYNDLLYNEWRERVYLRLLEQAVAESNLSHKLSFQRLPQAWAAQRPYRRGQDARHAENYSLYRRRRFDKFWQSRVELLPAKLKQEIEESYADRAQDLKDYQAQMTILATLEPERYRENRRLIPLWQARVGVVFQGRYYLLPACHTDQAGRPFLFESQEPDTPFYALQLNAEGDLYDRTGRKLRVDRSGQVYQIDTGQLVGSLRPAHFQAIRRQVTAIFSHQDKLPEGSELQASQLDVELLAIPRREQERARKELSAEQQEELKALKYAPFIINWDEQNASEPLAYIRQSKRGLGDHALTIFRTKESMICDLSHIFFDGAWGMALAEILTGEATSWAAYFNSLPLPEPANEAPYHPRLAPSSGLEKFPRMLVSEVSAENTDINMRALYTLCKLLPKRHPDLKLTVNDLLILYRCEFGHEYHPSSRVEDALFELQAQNTSESQAVYYQINNILAESQANNPSLMIPMDATATNPRERLYPTTFRNPFTEFWSIYQEALHALEAYKAEKTQATWAKFTDARRSFLAQLHYFGQLLRAYKKVALEGGSTSTATMKLMAHLPGSVLKLLDEIPRRIDILNEVIKGEEVFSNGGRVARNSSLTRFLSAKDDNENKTLVWGMLTDDNDVLHLSLRDFRPHVVALRKLNRTELAQLMVQDYVDSFVMGFNQFVTRLLDILNTTATHTSKEITE